MPKTDNALMKPKTSPGLSYTVPDARLLGFDCDEDGANPRIMVALDELEIALLERAAREVVTSTFPRSRAELVLPIGDHRGVPCLFSSGQFPVVIKDRENRSIETVAEGSTVRFRVMLKAYRAGDRIEVVAFPSRVDVIYPPLARESRQAEPAQIAMVLEPPPVTKPKKAPTPAKPKAAQKPKKTPPPFDKAAYARHRAEVVQARARQRARKAAETAPAVSFGSNVILFPLSPTKH